ncbi:zinc finger BED domain-containing protein 1-like [Rhizophagus irregularis DAOM 181602=DAOM 197198]|nr:zinc finger BED domain-containing protein 1-like [Rhizophagus irregularis DAOM 181602=DAOM 197198]
MFRKIISDNPQRKARLDQKFIGILVKDYQPLSIREDEEFLEFIYELDPLYQLPSEKRILELLTNRYNNVKDILVNKIGSDIINCSLTTNLWTARSRMGYIGITCAYIDKQFKLNEAILAIKYVPYPHTGEAIAEKIMSILSEWKLTDKVFTITTDNGSNMVKSARLIPGLIRIPCTIHTLQLVIGKGLLPAEVLIARAKQLMLFFTSPKQTEKLLEIQKNMNQVISENLQENDRYLRVIADDFINIMITTLCIDSDKQAKKDGKQLKGINFTKDEWNAISELIPILELFANATELLGGVKLSNSNSNEVEVVDFTEPNTTFDDDVEYEDSEDGDIANNQSKQRKIKINTPQDCKNLILKVKSALYESITYYWNISEDYRLIATLLDPCCKSLFFVSPELHSNIHLKLRSIYNEIKLEYSKQEKDCYEEYLTNSLLASMFSRRYERGDEITEYLRVEEIGFSECSFNWWSKNENRFPILSKMARKYLAIPATFTPSERLFSDAGNLMTVRHTSLSPSTFKHLLFLK